MTENERRFQESVNRPGKMAKCKGCDCPIVWMKTEKGSNIPVNPVRLSYREGNISILDANGVIHRNPKIGQDGWQPHWETCPKAGEFRKLRA